MTPRVTAILTVLVIGLVAFLIGWLLTNSKWKKRYKEMEDKVEGLEREQNLWYRKEKEHTEKETYLESNYSAYKKENKQLRNEVTRLRNELYHTK